jgi:hypothetical protein
VSDTLQVALQGSGLNQVKVLHRPRLLSDNGPSYVSSELGEWLLNAHHPYSFRQSPAGRAKEFA